MGYSLTCSNAYQQSWYRNTSLIRHRPYKRGCLLSEAHRSAFQAISPSHMSVGDGTKWMGKHLAFTVQICGNEQALRLGAWCLTSETFLFLSGVIHLIGWCLIGEVLQLYQRPNPIPTLSQCGRALQKFQKYYFDWWIFVHPLVLTNVLLSNRPTTETKWWSYPFLLIHNWWQLLC